MIKIDGYSQEAELREALPALKFGSIKYDRIQFDENYNSGSMDLQSFDQKALQSDINHGVVVDWEVMLEIR